MKEDTPHYKGHRSRLKEKYLHSGVDAFHDYEVLELLLGYAIPQKDVKPLAKDLLTAFGSLKGIMDADIESLSAISGMGTHTAILIKLVKDMSALYLKEQARDKTQISCTQELVDYCKTMLGGLKDEQFCVIYLDARNRLIDMETLQEGIVNQAVVYPRQVLERALGQKASAIILVHNHPSGHVKPSDADIRLTKTIQDAARMLEILVHDHVIIGENRFFSFREEGIMAGL
ncbi:MAG: DNA repair protein RadC [Syntrophales bacterium]|nr:DNA repair protein RadC [Syntrophales bacterium]